MQLAGPKQAPAPLGCWSGVGAVSAKRCVCLRRASRPLQILDPFTQSSVCLRPKADPTDSDLTAFAGHDDGQGNASDHADAQGPVHDPL